MKVNSALLWAVKRAGNTTVFLGLGITRQEYFDNAAARNIPIGHFKIIDFERTSPWRYIYINTNVSTEHDLTWLSYGHSAYEDEKLFDLYKAKLVAEPAKLQGPDVSVGLGNRLWQPCKCMQTNGHPCTFTSAVGKPLFPYPDAFFRLGRNPIEPWRPQAVLKLRETHGLFTFTKHRNRPDDLRSCMRALSQRPKGSGFQGGG